MTKHDRIQVASQQVVEATSELKGQMAVICTVATTISTLLNNPEVIRIIATAIVDVQEQMELINK